MRVNGEPPSPAELEAFCDRLNEITAAGGKLKLVQIYTIARRPAESYVTPLGGRRGRRDRRAGEASHGAAMRSATTAARITDIRRGRRR